MAKGSCRLCGVEGELLKKSHIIPDFVYNGVFDQHHRLFQFVPQLHAKGKGRVKRPPTGPYDSSILCRKCDTEILGVYETSASIFLFGRNPRTETDPRVEHLSSGESIVTNFDYDRLKLFFLGMIWKAHHSNHPLFKDVSLGTYEATIRRYLISGMAPLPDELPVFLMCWHQSSTLPTDMVTQIIKVKYQKRDNAYFMMFRGLVVYVFISPESRTENFEPCKLRKDRTIVLNLPDELAKGFFAKAFNLDPMLVARMGL